MKIFKKHLWVIASGFVVGLSACTPPVTEKPVPKVVDIQVPDATNLNKIDGRGSISISGPRSRPAIIYYSGTWTDSSAASIEWLNSFPRDTMDVIPVIVDRNLDEAQKADLLNQLPGLDPCAADEMAMTAFGKIRVLPTAILLGVDGRVRQKWEGYTPVADILADMLSP